MKALICSLFVAAAYAASTFSPIRPPSFPLAVRTPYLSAWLPGGKDGGILGQAWPQFWAGAELEWAGIARVDGVAYSFMGAVSNTTQSLKQVAQTSASFTSSETTFVATAGPVVIECKFLSPITPEDFFLQSMPFSYLTVRVTSKDNARHSVQIYTDINGAWAVGNTKNEITWNYKSQNQTGIYHISPAKPVLFSEIANQANYGSAMYATKLVTGKVTVQSGTDRVVRADFIKNGQLSGVQDINFRPVDSNNPVVAFAADLGSTEDATAQFAIGHARDPAIIFSPANGRFTNHSTIALQKLKSFENAIVYFLDSYAEISNLSYAFDAKVKSDATKISENYCAIVELSARQAFGGIEFTGGEAAPADTLVFLKEISSDGNVNTVDVIMPSIPIFLYANPKILTLMLEPLLRYQQAGGYAQEFALHDMGASYPKAIGHPLGHAELMPIEESGNMIIMALASAKLSKDNTQLTKYYSLFKKWADYLVNNTLIPGFQLATTDAAGPLANQTNLAIKGIIALNAMNQVAQLTNNDGSHYLAVSRSYVEKWEQLAYSKDKKHIKLAYQEDPSWGIQFNLFADNFLGLKFIPQEVYETLDAWYPTVANAYGVQLDTRVKWGKTDWNMWCAASSSPQVRDLFVDSIAKYLQSGSSNGPLPDRYFTDTGVGTGTRARPTVGAHFSLLIKSS